MGLECVILRGGVCAHVALTLIHISHTPFLAQPSSIYLIIQYPMTDSLIDARFSLFSFVSWPGLFLPFKQNFNIYTGMTPSVAKNTVSFVGHDNTEHAAVRGSATPFKLRLKTEAEANQLKDALDRAIEFVQSKSGSD